MDKFLALSFAGLCTAGIYAIAASGLVLTYTTTGVFNFAHGAVGMLAGFLYWQLRVQNHVPTPIALIIVIFVFAPAFGTVVERVLMRGLRGATVGTTLVVTVGLTVGLIGGVQAIWKPGEARFLGPLWGDRSVHLVGRTVTWDELTFIVGALAVGIIENLAIGYLPEGSFVSRLRPSLPTLFFFVALLALPEARLRVGRVVGRSTPRIPKFNESVVRAVGFVALAIIVGAV